MTVPYGVSDLAASLPEPVSRCRDDEKRRTFDGARG
jgi:hypothetical protein